MAAKSKVTAVKAAPVKAGDGKKFPLAKLRENCRQLFNVSASTFDGATYGMAGQFTVEEIKAHIKVWGNQRGVK